MLLEWTVPEFVVHERGLWWYLWAAVIAVAFLTYAVFTANFLFALIIFMAVLIIFLTRSRTPDTVTVRCDGRGLTVGHAQHSYSDLRSFWIVYEPPEVQTLHMLFRSSLRPRLVIQLGDQDPSLIRNFLKRYIEENLEHETEPLSDTLGRVLKL